MDARAEDKKERRSSDGEGLRWREQSESESVRGKNGETLR
jgi:hypothetical protein